jgi:hypothetical protein
LNVRLSKPPDATTRMPVFCPALNPVMLAHLDEVRAAGALVAEDGAVIDLRASGILRSLFVFGTELVYGGPCCIHSW